MKMPARIAQGLADLLLGYATYALLLLVFKQASFGDVCPPIAGVPACYILLAVVAIAWIGRFVKRVRQLYWVGIALPAVVALLATIGEVVNVVECPRSAGGIPMCFLSLGLFSTVIGLALLARFFASRMGRRKSTPSTPAFRSR